MNPRVALRSWSRVALWKVRDRIGLPPRTFSETSARLTWLAAGQTPYQRGRFMFPFGALEYVDPLSLRDQYAEIFIHKSCEVRCRNQHPVILDCGANIGLSVIAFKQQYPGSQITAFEADPLVAEVLLSNLAVLGFSDVKVVKAVAWVKNEQVPLARDNPAGVRLDFENGLDCGEAFRLADYVTERIDVLKLDIAGAEFSVIEDLCTAGKMKSVERLICEFHVRAGDRRRLGNVLNGLLEHGFHYVIAGAGPALHLTGDADPTPFPAAPDGKFLAQLYAWRLP